MKSRILINAYTIKKMAVDFQKITTQISSHFTSHYNYRLV